MVNRYLILYIEESKIVFSMKTIIRILAFLVLISCIQSKEKGSQLEFFDQKGEKVELSEIGESDSVYNFNLNFTGDLEIPYEADKLHKEARIYGSNGQYEKAIQNLLKAHELAPSWPFPVYDLGFTYLLMQNYSEALKYYEKTVELAPKGFYTAKTAYWCLAKESEGEFPQGLFINYMQIEWAPSNDAKIEIAEQIVNSFPNYAPAWNVLGGKLPDISRRMEAIKKGLELDSDIETKANLLINKALVLSLMGKASEAKQILDEIINDKANSLIQIEQAKTTLRYKKNGLGS